MSPVTTTGADLKAAVGAVFGGEDLAWAIVVARTTDGMEMVLSANEEGKEFDLLRIAQEFQLALKGLTYRELDQLSDIDGEAKEETP